MLLNIIALIAASAMATDWYAVKVKQAKKERDEKRIRALDEMEERLESH